MKRRRGREKHIGGLAKVEPQGRVHPEATEGNSMNRCLGERDARITTSRQVRKPYLYAPSERGVQHMPA